MANEQYCLKKNNLFIFINLLYFYLFKNFNRRFDCRVFISNYKKKLRN